MSNVNDSQLNVQKETKKTINEEEKIDEEKIDEEKKIKVVEKPIIKRKRGRPKKIRTEEDEKKIKKKKKRGRKPRPKTDESQKQIIKRKRGRKPRDRFYTLSNKQKKELLDTNLHQDSIIVFLPIDTKQLEKDQIGDNNLFIENSILTYKPNLNIPKPMEYGLQNEQNIESLNDNNIISVGIDNGNQSLHNEKSINHDLRMKDLMNPYREVEYHLHERGNCITTNVRNTMNEFRTANKTNEWVDATNIRCWWCCYEFDNKPISIPISFKKNVFNVYGCFCNFKCALAYNFNTDGNRKWERISLIHLLYKKMYNKKEVELEYAPPREFLKIFGGHMDIDEFRNLDNKRKKYEVVYPPMLSIIPQLEETEIFAESNKIRKSKKEIPVDDDRIQRAREKLKLKRLKPLRERNTLEQCMNLTRNKN